MLIKEYHILLPMSLDEYQVAQLYMILVRAREAGGRGSPTSCRSMQAAPGTGGWGSAPPVLLRAWEGLRPEEEREVPFSCRGRS